MDKATFEIVGNVGKTEIKLVKGGKRIAILSVATSERWKRDDGEWNEKTYWHRVAVFAPAKVERIETMVQKGTRLRLAGQIRPGSYEDEKGHTKYVVEFVIGPFGDVEVLARPKPRDEADDEPAPQRHRSKRAAGDSADQTARSTSGGSSMDPPIIGRCDPTARLPAAFKDAGARTGAIQLASLPHAFCERDELWSAPRADPRRRPSRCCGPSGARPRACRHRRLRHRGSAPASESHFMPISESTDKLSPAQRVTRGIESALSRGVRPWTRPWRDAPSYDPLGLPRRANGHSYRGVNVIALWAAAAEAGYQSPYWFTFKQALALGAQVRKGERGSFVVFYKELKPNDETPSGESDGAPMRRVLRGYVVFNRAQIEGLIDPRFDPPTPTAPPPADDLALRLAKVPAIVRFGGASAFYSASADYVQLPPKPAFLDPTQFYATWAHELGHWTRHPSRLDRDFGAKRFGDAGYALEELTAELCAAFVGAVIGLPADHVEDHAAYIGHWLKVLKDNPSAFLSAAAKAQTAADYLLRLMGEAPASEAPED